MNGQTGFAITASAGFSSLRTLAPRVEKSRFSNALHGERRDEERSTYAGEERLRGAKLSRSETFDAAPLWHGPRLRAAFVAQILGQALPSVLSRPGSYEPRPQRLCNLALDETA
ncbi:MAG: hypothetical protein HY243_03350 [Proteobacteria bacterium]|nr:hypothetical protein [Pseudomonadota bacterium]